MRFVLLSIALFVGLCTAAVRYDNYKVIRVTPHSQTDFQWLKRFAAAWENRVEFWTQPTAIERPVDIMVAPHSQSEFLDVLQAQGVDFTEHVVNLQELLEKSEDSVSRTRRSAMANDDFNYNVYHTMDEIYTWISDFVTEYSSLASEETITLSYEGRPVKAIKLGSAKTNKPIAYIQGGIHAREWISPATVIYLTKTLADNYNKDATVTAMLDTFDWYIVPVLNPDGYSYTWTRDRMWRKNRRRPAGNVCTGIDLNRNYGYMWGGTGSSDNACSQTYRGTSAFSEPELLGVSNFLLDKQKSNGVHLHMDFHSYGQYWLYPWGYARRSLVPLPDREDLASLAQAAEDAITATHRKDYFVGESGPDMYPASGSSEDWGYGSLGAKYTYVIELRDEGKYGFLLPDTDIQPTMEEIFAAMKVVGTRLVSEFGSV